MVVAGALGADTAVAVVVGAALALRLAGIGVGAAIFAGLAITDASSIGACGAFAVAVGIGAALVVLTGSVDAGLATPALGIVTAFRAIVLWSSVIAAPLPSGAVRNGGADPIVADASATEIFKSGIAVFGNAALCVAGPITAMSVLALIEADASAALVAGVADFRIASARIGVADGAGVGTEILVDALSAIAARQRLAGDGHAVALVR